MISVWERVPPPERIPVRRTPPGKMTERSSARPAVILTSGASGRLNALLSMSVLRCLLILLNGALLLLLLPFRRWARLAAEAEESARKVTVRVPAAMVPRRAREGEAAARRALAIRRVGEEETSKRRWALFHTQRGDTLFTQSWTPASAPIKGIVVLMHGLNEHSGRYNYFAKKLNDSGFKVYAMDWIGHGGSDCLHGYVPSLDYAVNDLKAFLNKIFAENSGLPCFCFGHSTGGAIILKGVLDPEVERRIDGIVLTSPAIRVQPSHPLVVLLAPLLALFLPRYQFTGANKGPPVSRDPVALKDKYSDPLVFTGSIRVRTGYEILRMTSFLQQNLERINVPFLVLHGKADSVTDPKTSQRLHDVAASADKSIELFEGLLHDLLFEPEKDMVVRGIVDWLRARVVSS